jgi:hypothetical protein
MVLDSTLVLLLEVQAGPSAHETARDAAPTPGGGHSPGKQIYTIDIIAGTLRSVLLADRAPRLDRAARVHIKLRADTAECPEAPVGRGSGETGSATSRASFSRINASSQGYWE